MLGSSNSIACANIMLNAAVAESLRIYADRLEGAQDFESALHDLIRETVKVHKRIIFNGNGYDEAWIREATEKRRLHNLRTTPDALPALLEKKNMEMLISHKVYTEAELRSRYEITLENYCKTVEIEALTMVDMAKKEILPAVVAYTKELADTYIAKASVLPTLAGKYEKDTISSLSMLSDEIDTAVTDLEMAVTACKLIDDMMEASHMIRDVILQKMAVLRVACDQAETMTAEKYWPFPTYGKLLFGVK